MPPHHNLITLATFSGKSSLGAVAPSSISSSTRSMKTPVRNLDEIRQTRGDTLRMAANRSSHEMSHISGARAEELSSLLRFSSFLYRLLGALSPQTLPFSVRVFFVLVRAVSVEGTPPPPWGPYGPTFWFYSKFRTHRPLKKSSFFYNMLADRDIGRQGDQ